MHTVTLPIATRWLPALQRCRRPNSFVARALLLFAAASIRQRRRSSASVAINYDTARAAERLALPGRTWEQYVYGSDDVDFILDNGAVQLGPLSASRRRVLDRLHSLAQEALDKGNTLVEFGAGDGRNLLYLKKAFPQARLVGFELSSTSVDLAKAAANQFGIEIEAYAANCAEPMHALVGLEDVALTFSVHALEQMPRTYVHAVNNMLRTKAAIVAMFEPVVELYPWSPRGLAARCRARAIDRMRGLAATVQQLESGGIWRLDTCCATGFGDNPVNETCEIVLRRIADLLSDRVRL